MVNSYRKRVFICIMRFIIVVISCRFDQETRERQAEQLRERLAKETGERQTLREKCQQLERRVEEGRASRTR